MEWMKVLPILIFLASFAMLGRFVLMAWRARLFAAENKPLSSRIENVLGTTRTSLKIGDFETMEALLRICPALSARGKSGLPFVHSYYYAIRWLLRGLASSSNLWQRWAERELEACSRYEALRLDARLQQNQSCISEYLGV